MKLYDQQYRYSKLYAACNLTLNYQVLRFRNVVENLQISIGCVTIIVSHLYFVNMCQ